LGIELLPESEEDVRRAAVVDFGLGEAGEDVEDGALAKPLFGGRPTRTGPGKDGKKRVGVTKAEREMARRKDGFVSRVIGNTRAVRDPFLNGGGRAGPEAKGPSSAAAPRLPGVKRKREGNEEPGPSSPPPPTKVPAQTGSGLMVNYDDSD
jgi:coiled-coil domain-containing protein 130